VKKALFRGLRVLFVGYAILVLGVAGCQNRLLYHPRVSPEAALLKEAGARGVLPWRDESGALIGWRVANPKARARLLVFHGNAVDAVERAQYLQTFAKVAGGENWEPYVMEYPGYGARAGSPGRESFYEAARKAIATLRAKDARPVCLLGESIGSATACAMAGELKGIAGVVLVVPFARLADVAQRAMPYIPVRLILRDAYDNIDALKKYAGPVFVAVAEFDEVVSADQGKLLYGEYAGPKALCEMRGRSHNTFEVSPETPWVREADAFLSGAIKRGTRE
jgi:uncharacterized protein